MTRATGHVRVIPRKRGDVFYAKTKLPDGSEPQRRYGKVWTKRTRPPDGYLTRGMAQSRLEAMLAGDDPLVNLAPSHVTFGQACDEHVRYLEHDRQRKPSYIKECRSIIRCYLLPALGESTPVENIATSDIDALRERLLSGPLAHKTVQKALTLLHRILGRAKRKGWIAANPADDAEKVTVRRSDEFNVLDIEQVHAVARAAATELLSSMIVVAAFTGLRQGELLALRWRHVDFANRILHVRRNLAAGTTEEDAPKSHRVRSVPLSDQALVALAPQQARALHRPRRPRVRQRGLAGTYPTTSSATRSTRRSTRPGSGACEPRPTRSCGTTSGTRSAPRAQRRASTYAASRRGWGTPTSRPRCAICTTCRSTMTRHASRPRSRARTCPQTCPEPGSSRRN